MDGETLQKSTRVLGYGLLAMVVTHTLIHAAGNIRSTLFPLLKEEFTLTNQQIGLIAAIPPLCQALLSVPAGFLSDRFGAKRLIALSILLAAAGSLLAGFTANPLMYIVATTLLTLNSTIYHPPSHAYTANLADSKSRARALGFLNAGGTFGMSLGPLSVTLLMVVLALQWRQVYLFWVVPILLGLVILYFVRAEPPQERKLEAPDDLSEPGQPSKLLSTGFVLFLSSSGVRRFGGSMTTGFLSIWLVESQGWEVADIGLMFGIASLLGIVGSPLGGELAYRIGEKRWAVISLLASYTCFVAAITLKGYIPFMLFYLARRFFGTMAMTANSAITATLCPPEQRGTGFALSFVPASVAGALAPMVAAYIADAYGLYPIFTVAAVIFFIGLGVLQFGVQIE
ncbi:MAG: MFS transporter [Candidatus Bathyarchaeota archaeon]|nr:MAG: MFS transporter [Candidatus Bathyarchaeota archaeon]